MPYRLFHSSGYDADAIKLMSEVFDDVCTDLRLANREDRLRDIIAYEVIECVKRDQRDHAAIKSCVRNALSLPG